MRIKEQPVKKKKGLAAKRRRRVGDEDEAEEELQREKHRKDSDTDDDDDDEEEKEPAEDPLATYSLYQLVEAVIELMLPGETVAAALRRLGGLGGRKKKGKPRQGEEGKEDTQSKDSDKLDKLTALADRLVGVGQFDIYQQTYEKLAYKLKGMNKNKPAKTQDDNDQEEDELDMFAEKFDDKHVEKEKDEDNSRCENV